jgi:hypothetical protein
MRGVLMRLVSQGKKLPTWEVGAVEAPEQERGEDDKPMLRVLSHNVWCHVLQQVSAFTWPGCNFLAQPLFPVRRQLLLAPSNRMDIIWSSAQESVAYA